MPSTDKRKIETLLTRNVQEVIEKQHLGTALRGGKKLRVKLGIDPTASDLHLGHAVVLQKLREFQELGHRIVLIIGDFTAQIGDPSGRAEARKPLTKQEVARNMKAYLTQAAAIIDVKKAEVHHNSDWFRKGGVQKILELARAGSMQQVLRREDFKKRLSEDRDVSLLELLYPLFQGYDSVEVRADVEIGGTDQLFNLLMGRRVQRHYGMKQQDVLTTKLLVGLDGKRKMSKSFGNFVALNDSPQEQYGKIMSLRDELLVDYFKLTIDIPDEEVKHNANLLESKKINPKEIKEKFAYAIVRRYHGDKAAERARDEFEKVFSKRQIPKELPSLKLSHKKISIIDLLMASGVVKSKSEARRLIEQGAVELDGMVRKEAGEQLPIKNGTVLKIGKRHFFRIRV